MAYATYDDIVAKYGEDFTLQCFDRDEIGAADVAALDAILEETSSLIDSYVAVRYGLPLDPVPPILVSICIDIAIYKASFTSDTLTEEKRKRNDDAIAWLKAVAAGDAEIIVINDDTPPADNRALILFTTQRQEFTRRKLRSVF